VSWYYLSLGSNLEPEKNMLQAIRYLSKTFGKLLLLPVVRTTPCNMASNNNFLNTLVVINSTLDEVELKTVFNSMEEAAGRDRSDPERSTKDRPLDIDIIAASHTLSLAPFSACNEPYCLVSLQALEKPAESFNTVALPFSACSLTGHRAATIDTDHSGGHILVVENAINSLLQSLEATFNR